MSDRRPDLVNTLPNKPDGRNRVGGRGRGRGRGRDANIQREEGHGSVNFFPDGKEERENRGTVKGTHKQSNEIRGERVQKQEDREDQQSKGPESESIHQDHDNRAENCKGEDQGQETREQDLDRKVEGERSRRQDEQNDDPCDSRFCQYCGNDILREQALHKENNRIYHRDCHDVHRRRCLKAVKAFHEKVTLNGNVLWIGIHVQYLFGQKTKDKTKKDKRDAKLKELLKKVTALRNSDSGHILIHFVGLAPGDNFTGAFDEFADRKLQDLINDGSLFSDVYRKERLSAAKKPGLSEFTDVLVLFVKEGKFLATSDIKSKLALDDCIIDIPELTLLEFIREGRQFKEEDQVIPKYELDDLHQLQESRNLQTKAWFQPTNSNKQLVHSVCNKLRLKEYVSAFSKNSEGGSYLLGLAEEDCAFAEEDYLTKRLTVKPVTIQSTSEFERAIKLEILKNLLVCSYDGEVLQNPNLVQTAFILTNDTSQSTNNAYVVHVFVKSVSGVVFDDKDGPLAYKVDTQTNSVSRVSVQQWFRAFKHRLSIQK